MDVEQIIAGMRRSAEAPQTALERSLAMLASVESNIVLIEGAVRPSGDEAVEDWAHVYHAIWSDIPGDLRPSVDAALAVADLSFDDYDDPNYTYEADCRAWFAAFRTTHARVRELRQAELEAA